MTTPTLHIQDLHFAYPDGRTALAGADLTVGPGERVAVLGPNGAGKTTLALHLNGILRADRGTVTISGVGLSDDTVAEIRRKVGMVFQDANDQLFMPTVFDDVAFGPALLGLSGPELGERVVAALKAVEAEETTGRAPHHLSGGERRRVAIATVLAMEPDVLVLDEPASDLDPAGRRELISLLTKLEVTQLIVTHDLLLALELCPRTVIMDRGRIVADGLTAELLADENLLAAHRLELPFGVRGIGSE
jgi:cobalt/nickel transport system ATP-binding protein